MKKILILLLFCGFWANAQQYHDKGAKFEFATNVGDTVTVNTRVPIFDEFGLINYYVDVADLLALNPEPVLEWGNITGTLSDQTDLQGALNDKADQSALTAHTSNGSIHFTQSAISITESQVSDLKDYLRGDVNDTNGSNKLTLGSLEVVGQTTLQNGLNLTSIPVGTSDNILTLNQSTGDVEQRVFSLGDIDIANESGVSQFPVGLGDQLRIQGSGDTSISFDGITNTINIHSTPGSGGGGAVTSFNGRDGAVVSQAGDYSTAMVNENTNLYFTEPRVRATPLTGLTVTNTPISSTNTFIQALGRLQGQINDRYTKGESDGRYLLNTTDQLVGNLTVTGTVTGNSHIIAKGGTSPLELHGNGVGDNNGVFMELFESNGTVRQGYIGFTTGSSTLRFNNDVGGNQLELRVGNPENDLVYNNANGARTVYHSGNLRSDSQNDSRYFRKDVTDTKDGTANFNGEVNIRNVARFTEDLIRGVSISTNATDGAAIGTYTNHDFLLKRGNSTKLTLTSSGVVVDGTVTGSNLSGTNTGDQTLSGLGGVPTSRTITAGDGLIGGGNLSSNRTLSVDGTVARMNTTNSGSLRASGNIISDSNIQASSAIISGAGSFGGRVSGSDAINANEFVTRQQVVPLSTQQTGVVRAIEAISSALTVDDGVYMEKGGVQYALTVPAGTFQQSGRGILDIEGIMEMSNITQNKTLLVYITFSQGETVYNSDPMAFDLSTTDGGAFGHFKATLTSRMSAGYFFGKGIVTGSDSNGSITQGFVINPPTSLDFRESFTIRMRVNSTTGYNMVLIPFTVKVSDLPN